MIVSAPGKLILAGEYAVLDGAPAIVAAVARRARARAARPGEVAEPSPFLDAAGVTGVIVDTSALRDAGGVKLGLGSSAAATVAAVGWSLGVADRARVHRIAAAAHAEVQAARGAAGSGADIAAAVFGGVLRFQAGAATPLILPPMVWIPLWTGRPADTVDLIRAVAAARRLRPDEVGAAIAAAGRAAEALATARDAAAVIAALDAGADAIARLGAAAGLDLETAPIRAARTIARAAGGAVKTCGAGGGDVAIAGFPAGTEITGIVQAFHHHGCIALNLPFDPRGVDTDPDGA